MDSISPFLLKDFMSLVTKVGDQPVLVETSKYPSYAHFPFEKFNPVQSRVIEFFEKDCNAVIAAKTSAGKTVIAEILAARQVREVGGKIIYLAPMKALAKEKLDDWTDAKHHFSDLKIAICTGDFQLTDQRKKELEEANLIVMTSEMLNSRCRNMKSEKSEFLKHVSLCVADESHLLAVPGRGDHLEVGLMNLAKIAPNVRFCLLSATMPNVKEIAEWIAESLNNKETYLLESEYRPCPLGVHYESYSSYGSYDDQEDEKISTTIKIVDDHPTDKFLLFVHTKRTGEKLLKTLKRNGYEAEFHKGDLDKDKRHSLEKRFREGKLQYLISTSTLAWGVNTPARRVVIVGVHRGMSVVDTWDIFQMIGRSGRPGYDDRGDAYILVPDTKADEHINRLKTQQPIVSRLLDNIGDHYKTLAFHVVSEIHHGGIKTKDDVKSWYKRTLAHFQSKQLDDRIVNSTIDLLIKCGAIKEEEGKLKVTVVGMVSSMFYYSPFDAADLRRNFMWLFKEGLHTSDLHVALALGNVDSNRMGIVSRAEREDFGDFMTQVWKKFGRDTFTEPAIKGAFMYYSALTGQDAGSLAALVKNVQFDYPRQSQVLMTLDSMGCKWNKKAYFNEIQSRISYGVRSELVPLIKLPEVGKVRAENLWNAGIKSPQDLLDKQELAKKTLNLKAEKFLEIVNAANGMVLSGD